MMHVVAGFVHRERRRTGQVQRMAERDGCRLWENGILRPVVSCQATVKLFSVCDSVNIFLSVICMFLEFLIVLDLPDNRVL